MRKFLELFLLSCVLVCPAWVFADQAEKSDYFAGQDIHLSASRMCVYPSLGDVVDEQIIVFDEKFSLDIGANLLSSDQAVVWITARRYKYRGALSFDYDVRAYLEGNVKVSQRQGGQAKDDEAIFEHGKSLVVHFFVSGEVYATADERVDGSAGDLVKLGVYKNASKASGPLVGRLTIPKEAIVPPYKNEISVIDEKFGKQLKNKLRASDYFDIGEVEASVSVVDIDSAPKSEVVDEPDVIADSNSVPESDIPDSLVVSSKAQENEFRYPINISGLWSKQPEMRTSQLEDGSKVATLIGRFYLWQKKNDRGDIIEFQADNAVIFYDIEKVKGEGKTKTAGDVNAVYFSGDILMTEGERTIRAAELFYDFVNKRSLAVKAEMHNFDDTRGVPIYVRAAKLQQITENVFQAENIVLTASEFYVPQLSMTASQLVMTDLRGIESRGLGLNEDSKFDLVMTDITMKAGKTPFFVWPRLRSDLERPDLPIKRIQVGKDSDFGTVVQTHWYLSRLLGLKEPDGVDSTLQIDYFSHRGSGGGVNVDYKHDDYYGGVSSYFIKDRGTDDLGRTRQNEALEADTRGRFTSRHRHYLPYSWQATLETGYLSDKNFMESFYRSEFNTAKGSETLLHLKRLEDFWAFSFLTKVRINDFMSEIEELPTAELHFKGVSFWDNLLTYYGDTRISRLRDRVPAENKHLYSEQFYTFFTSRHEVDAPMRLGAINIVPFVAGGIYIDDNKGFVTNIDNTRSDVSESKTLLGEAGVRMSTLFWKEDLTFKSDYWDVDGLRHIIKPHVEAIAYRGDEDVIDMRNFMNFGLSQRWQTRRGPVEKRRNLDWMRLDVDATFLSDTEEHSISQPGQALYGPAKFIWNDPAIPIHKRRDSTMWGMVRDSINADYNWRISDTTIFMTDLNYDTKAGVIQQYNVGVMRYVYPDISYYVGSRYFRPVTIDVPESDVNPERVHEEGSNSVIGSITYALNNRYSLILSEEYNLDYGHNVRSEISLLRRYHRLYCGLTFSVDESREQKSLTFSLWPQGVKELAFGDRKYASFRDGVLEN